MFTIKTLLNGKENEGKRAEGIESLKQSLLIFYQYIVVQSFRMENPASASNKPKIYDKITLSKRQALVEEVLASGLSICKIAKKHSIKLSTAKLIVKKYKEQGIFFEKRSDRQARLREMRESPNQAQLPPIISQPSPLCPGGKDLGEENGCYWLNSNNSMLAGQASAEMFYPCLPRRDLNYFFIVPHQQPQFMEFFRWPQAE